MLCNLFGNEIVLKGELVLADSREYTVQEETDSSPLLLLCWASAPDF